MDILSNENYSQSVALNQYPSKLVGFTPFSLALLLGIPYSVSNAKRHSHLKRQGVGVDCLPKDFQSILNTSNVLYLQHGRLRAF